MSFTSENAKDFFTIIGSFVDKHILSWFKRKNVVMQSLATVISNNGLGDITVRLATSPSDGSEDFSAKNRSHSTLSVNDVVWIQYWNDYTNAYIISKNTYDTGFSVDGDLSVGGDEDILGNLDVTGQSTVDKLTATGTTHLRGPILVNNDANYSGILFAPTETTEWRAGLHLDGRHNSSYKRNRLYLNQRSFSSSTYEFGDYYEQYLFPTVEMDLTENKSYNILTEKSYKSLFNGTAAVGDTISLPDVFDYKLYACRLKSSGGSVSGTIIPMVRTTRSTSGTNYLRGMCSSSATHFEEVTFSATSGSTTFTVQSANRTTVSSGANTEYVVADIWGII